MRIVAIATFAATFAAGAPAFTPTDVVTRDGAALYDAGASGDEGRVVATLPYWTAVRAEPYPSQSPKTYGHAALADGREGDMEWDDLGRILVVGEAGATIYERPDASSAELARVQAGAWLAEVRVVHAEQEGKWREVMTAAGDHGWVAWEAAAAPAADGR